MKNNQKAINAESRKQVNEVFKHMDDMIDDLLPIKKYYEKSSKILKKYNINLLNVELSDKFYDTLYQIKAIRKLRRLPFFQQLTNLTFLKFLFEQCFDTFEHVFEEHFKLFTQSKKDKLKYMNDYILKKDIFDNILSTELERLQQFHDIIVSLVNEEITKKEIIDTIKNQIYLDENVNDQMKSEYDDMFKFFEADDSIFGMNKFDLNLEDNMLNKDEENDETFEDIMNEIDKEEQPVENIDLNSVGDEQLKNTTEE